MDNRDFEYLICNENKVLYSMLIRLNVRIKLLLS